MSRRLVAKRVSGQDLHDQLGIGIGVEYEVDDRVGGRAIVAAEGIVQQMIEDPPVQLGLALVVAKEADRGSGPLLPGTGRRVAHPEGQCAHGLHLTGHLVCLPVEDDLEPVFDPPQEPVCVVHDVPLLGAEAADPLELRDGVERVAASYLGVFAAMEELEELDDELDVADAAPPRLDLDLRRAGRDGALLNPALEGLDLGDLGRGKVSAINERGDRLLERPAQRQIAGHGPALEQRLAFPGPPSGHVIVDRRIERAGHRPLFPVRTEAHVDPVGHPQRGVLGQQADHLAPHPREKFGVGNDLGPGGLAVLIVEEDEVDVRAVVQLDAPELSQAQDDEPSGRAPRCRRFAEPRLSPRPG